MKKIIICIAVLILIVIAGFIIYKQVYPCNFDSPACYDKLYEKYETKGCEKLSIDRYLCYRYYASKDKDASICDFITVSKDAMPVQYKRDDCYANTAKETNDSSICSKVISSVIKQDCLDYFNR